MTRALRLAGPLALIALALPADAHRLAPSLLELSEEGVDGRRLGAQRSH